MEFQKISNPKEERGAMYENSMKGLMVMIILLVTLLPFSTHPYPPSLHPSPLPGRLLSFNPDDGFKLPWKRNAKVKNKELEECYRKCDNVYWENRM